MYGRTRTLIEYIAAVKRYCHGRSTDFSFANGLAIIIVTLFKGTRVSL